jgi:osmotically inducible lipoprotein OsmB
MRKLMTIGALIAVASGLAACGQTPASRMATGAAVGAGAAALGAWAYDEDPGRAAVIGAGLGAAGGLMTPPGTFDGGYPWGI